MAKEIGVGRSHSKIILIGEHSVVYGYPALAIPLNTIEVICRIYPAKRALLVDAEDPLSIAISSAIKHLGVPNPHLSYKVESMVPKKRGMGSSAAVSIAAIRAVFDYFEVDLDVETLENLSNRAETIAHMNPSGLDSKACLSDVAIRFIKNGGCSRMDIDLAAYLIIADTGIPGRTKEAIRLVQKLGRKARPILHSLGHLTKTTHTYLTEKNLFKVGQNLSFAHRLLKKLGVSCRASDELVETALRSGALGAKMTGGGLGGCIIALVSEQEDAEQLSQRLREKGAINTWIESL